jgi:hypothetical protein
MTLKIEKRKQGEIMRNIKFKGRGQEIYVF